MSLYTTATLVEMLTRLVTDLETMIATDGLGPAPAYDQGRLAGYRDVISILKAADR